MSFSLSNAPCFCVLLPFEFYVSCKEIIKIKIKLINSVQIGSSLTHFKCDSNKFIGIKFDFFYVSSSRYKIILN